MRRFSHDDKRPLLRRQLPAGVKAFILILVSIGFIFTEVNSSALNPLRDALALAVEPLQVVAELPTETYGYIKQYSQRDQLLKQNNTLKRENLVLKGKLQKLAALKAENDRIRDLLGTAQTAEQDFLIAGILSVDPSPYRHTILLDKGYLDGVFKGQPLIDSNGIMGQVTQVTPMSARAVLITDANSAIPVEINRTGLRTIAKGTGQSGQLKLNFLPKSANIKIGDLLVTSGLGGRYPAGYPVARITKIDKPEGSEFMDISAQPTAKLDHGINVLLVKNKMTQSD